MPTTYAIPNGRTAFGATLFTGNGSTQTVNNASQGTLGFKPDFVWIKQRDAATYSHNLYDSNRGVNKALFTDGTTIEVTYTDRLLSFDTTGFGLGGGAGTNSNGSTRVGWSWVAGQGVNNTNTNGSITSTVSANTTTGFSIVTYTGTGAAATIGHGLSTAPQFIVCKSRTTSGNWVVYHVSTGASSAAFLDLPDAFGATAAAWNSTAPTSSVFSVAGSANSNPSGASIVAYCWAPVAGFSQFGSYTANANANGPFIYTGFRPAYVMFKKTNSTSNWMVLDNTRNTYNVENTFLLANVIDAESTTVERCDFLSNGIKIRAPSGYTPNETAGDTYLYIAFAENPFKYANAR